jgi:hypothetical protein
VITLTENVSGRVDAYIEARVDGPLFLDDVASSFSEPVAVAWIHAQMNAERARWRVIDPHGSPGPGPLIVEAYPPAPRSAWATLVVTTADLELYALALKWAGRTPHLDDTQSTQR